MRRDRHRRRGRVARGARRRHRVLLRDGPASGRPEVWMMTRVNEMAFAAGASVFPGRSGRRRPTPTCRGRAGPADASPSDFGCDVELAHALVAAAVRETFEETGVLLTTPPRRRWPMRPAESRTGQRDLRRAADRARAGDRRRRVAPVGALDHAGPSRDEPAPLRHPLLRRQAAAPAPTPANLTTESVVASGSRRRCARRRRSRRAAPDAAYPHHALVDRRSTTTVDEILAGAAGRSLAAGRPEVEIDDQGRRPG